MYKVRRGDNEKAMRVTSAGPEPRALYCTCNRDLIPSIGVTNVDIRNPDTNAARILSSTFVGRLASPPITIHSFHHQCIIICASVSNEQRTFNLMYGHALETK
jgi:hypothetical protein